MKRLISFLIVLVFFISCAGLPSQESRLLIDADFPAEKLQAQIDSTQGLFARNLGASADKFEFEIIPTTGNDWFEYSSVNGKILIKGRNAVSIASGLYNYLTNYCSWQIGWNGESRSIPEILPQVKAPVYVETLHKYRPYFNYCTFNYTASWWDWERWEQEIDLMAMRGINMPLAAVGLEGTWYYTLLELGFTDLEAREYLVGPAFFAWQWMGNIENHCGPLPKSWIDSHIDLGKKIIDRQVSMGMMPIQQGFSGTVPRLMKEKFPEAGIAVKGLWCSFPGAAQLDPMDPLFDKMGKIFLETQKRLFGAHGYYAADPFHEGEAPVSGNEYLRGVGKKIYTLVKDFDPAGKTVMQAWSIQSQIATQFPREDILVLDLDGYKRLATSKFWGLPYVTGILHNFGGRINMHGDLRHFAKNAPARLAKSRLSGNNQGSGMFMEGIVQNPVFYDLIFDLIWARNSVELNSWEKAYIQKRYNVVTDESIAAWDYLIAGPYGKRSYHTVEASSILCSRPAISGIKSGPNDGFKNYYESSLVYKSWELLLAHAQKSEITDGLEFDIMDVTRQSLSNYAQEVYAQIIEAYKARDRVKFEEKTKLFINIIEDVDRILATRSENNFGVWLADAKSWATNADEAALYELNASMLVTHWGPEMPENWNKINGERSKLDRTSPDPDGIDPTIFDYSWREWSGLLSTYYKVRWEMFFEMLDKSLAEGTSYSDGLVEQIYGRPALKANDFNKALTEFEFDWIYKTKDIPPVSGENTVEISKELFEKYKSLLRL
ncbi:MAG: alpha-N-acetylglucosaminidase [Spirochaetales bacterium]|nr:alpha-N-acetylglucosaminidase [Spirochaetales bacterium]